MLSRSVMEAAVRETVGVSAGGLPSDFCFFRLADRSEPMTRLGRAAKEKQRKRENYSKIMNYNGTYYAVYCGTDGQGWPPVGGGCVRVGWKDGARSFAPVQSSRHCTQLKSPGAPPKVTFMASLTLVAFRQVVFHFRRYLSRAPRV